MTTHQEQKFICGLCDGIFTDLVVSSAGDNIGRDTELRDYAQGAQPIQHGVHTCPKCGYTDESHRYRVDHEHAQSIFEYLSSLNLQGNWKQLKPSRKHQLAAHIGILKQESCITIGYRYLTAAWCADDENDPDAAGQLRERCLQYYCAALDRDELYPEDIPTVTYLVGELYRRMGRFDESMEWFSRVVTKNSYTRRLCDRQKVLASGSDAMASMLPPESYFNPFDTPNTDSAESGGSEPEEDTHHTHKEEHPPFDEALEDQYIDSLVENSGYDDLDETVLIEDPEHDFWEDPCPFDEDIEAQYSEWKEKNEYPSDDGDDVADADDDDVLDEACSEEDDDDENEEDEERDEEDCYAEYSTEEFWEEYSGAFEDTGWTGFEQGDMQANNYEYEF